ncbi:MAG: GNAT family N-acetyltransferase [Actinomycetota bacterium]|nr:GNAT family N-acetyltransferase [Actinomycetota bacterium]
MLELVSPARDRHEEWLESHREWGPGLHEDGFAVQAGDDLESAAVFGGWVEWLRSGPETFWWIVEGDAVLGGIALRPYGEVGHRVIGHIGYGIRPSARGRGVATWALTQVLDRARDAAMPGCGLACRDDNLGSITTIERCGGVLQHVLEDDHGLARHYWVAL